MQTVHTSTSRNLLLYGSITPTTYEPHPKTEEVSEVEREEGRDGWLGVGEGEWGQEREFRTDQIGLGFSLKISKHLKTMLLSSF